MKKWLVVLIMFFLVGSCAYAIEASDLKIGIVNMNKVINMSNEGKRKKKMLEAQARQTQKLLKMKEEELRAMEKDLKDNIMLNAAAKAQKQSELNKKRQEFRQDVNKAQKSFRQDEARHTSNIFKDLVVVVKKIATDEKFDLVLEFNITQSILYTKYNLVDITEKVTAEYNKIQSLK
jgi:outer membrane protein